MTSAPMRTQGDEFHGQMARGGMLAGTGGELIPHDVKLATKGLEANCLVCLDCLVKRVKQHIRCKTSTFT